MRHAPPRRITPCMPHQELERELKAWEAQEAGAAAEAASEEQEAQRVRIDEFVAQQEGLSYARPARTRPSHHHGRPLPQALTQAWPCGLRRQSDISGRSGKSVATAATMGRSLLSADTGKHAADTSFWVPQLTPQARTTLKKPISPPYLPYISLILPLHLPYISPTLHPPSRMCRRAPR